MYTDHFKEIDTDSESVSHMTLRCNPDSRLREIGNVDEGRSRVTVIRIDRKLLMGRSSSILTERAAVVRFIC